MIAFVHALTPSLADLIGTLALLAVVAGLAAIGAWAMGPQRSADGDILYGWALVALLFTLVGALRIVPFGAVALLALAIAVVAAIVLAIGRRAPVAPALRRLAVLSVPPLLIVGAMAPSQWDEFTNWLPNARYLLEHDGFPAPGMAENPSVFPAYPYGLPLIAYLASRISGHFVENAIALFNLVLLLSFGLLLARMMRAVLAGPLPADGLPGKPVAPADGRLGWGWCAFGALAVTGLNPTFVPKIVFTAYADSATAVALGFAAAFGWTMLNAVADGRAGDARRRAMELALAGIALVLTKQVNLVLLAALIGAMAVVALRDRAVPFGAFLRLALAAAGPPLIAWLVWRLYVAANISGGEFAIRPAAEWLLALVPDVIGRMALIAAKKGGYFGIMLVALGFAVRALLRPVSELGRLAILAAGVFLGYNAFLLFAYVASFGDYDALRAASYWRYNTHLGGVCLLFAAYGGARLWRHYMVPRWRPRLGWLAVALALALPVALAPKLRFDQHPRYIYARNVAGEIARMLAPTDRLLLIDPEDDGQYLVIMRYRMHGSAKVADTLTAYGAATPGGIAEAVARTRPSHIWLYRPVPAAVKALGVRLAPGASHLLARAADGWSAARSWPHPGPAAR